MKKKMLVIRLDEDMHEKLKDISYETRNSISHIIREGMKLCIEALEEERGKPFEKRFK
jgi:predicted DNA-binding protein